MSSGVKKRLREFRAPDETGAESRAWDVVRSAYLEREQVVAPRRPRWRLAVAPAAAVIIAALALSPAGASVGRFITRALGEQHAAPALFSLPSSGRILVSGPGGTWTAAADGSTRRLGPWSQASWSPHGLFVVVASGDRLAAVDPRGTVRWALARPAVSDPRWYSPSGYRVAYLSAGTLRVLAGDGTGDRLLATGVAHVAPAWRPGGADGPYELAYVTARGRVVVRDGDTGRIVWSTAPGPRPFELMWSDHGARLLVLSRRQARTYAAGGAADLDNGAPLRAASDGALSPDGRSLALVLGGREVVVGKGALVCGRRSPAPVSQRSAGRPTAVGCSSRGRPRTSGCSSAWPGLPGSTPFPGSPSSSRAAARRAPSRSSTGGAARHRVRRDDSRVRVRLGDPGGAGGGMRRGVAPHVAATDRTPRPSRRSRPSARRLSGTLPPPSHLSRRSSPTSSRTGCWSSTSRAGGWSGGWRCHPIPRTSPPTAARARASS